MSIPTILFMSLVISIFVCVGVVTNARWKNSVSLHSLAPFGYLLLVGAAGWVFLITLFLDAPRTTFISLLVILLLLLFPIMKMKAGGGTVTDIIKISLIIVLAGAGKWGKFVLCWTLIGIPLVGILERAGDVGMAAASIELAEASLKARQQREAMGIRDKTLSELFQEISDIQEQQNNLEALQDNRRLLAEVEDARRHLTSTRDKSMADDAAHTLRNRIDELETEVRKNQ